MCKYKAYKFRIHPSDEQKTFFAKSFGCVRLVYNLMLDARISAYENTKKTPGLRMKFPTPAQYKIDYPFLKEVDSLALANAQLHLEKAYKNFFQDKSFGFPKFKSKKNPVQSYTTNNQKGTVRIMDGKYLKVPKLKSLIRIKLHRQIKGVIKSITLTKKPSGKYYVSILCEEEITEMPKTNTSIGIDLGITDFAILSNGDKSDNNRFTAEMAKKLMREQRKLSRRTRLAKEKGIPLLDAKNVQKQKVTVARLYEKVVNQRTDYLNKLSTDLMMRTVPF